MSEGRREIEVEIGNSLGLHTRPAKEFVQLANQFQAQIFVDKGELPVNGKSIMGLMSLLVPRGTRLRITATGPDADEALEALEALIHRRFGEE